MGSDDVAVLIAVVARGVEPDIAAIVAGAERRGRRLRARRRLLAMIASAACVTAIAAAITAAVARPDVGLGRGAGRGRPAGAGASHSPRGQRPARARRPLQAHGPGMTSRQLLAVLRPMLPPGRVVYVFPPIGRGLVEINFDDGHGAADIMLDVEATPWPPRPGFAKLPAAVREQMRRMWWQALRCPHPLWTNEGPRPAGAPPISCRTRTLRDRSIESESVTYADAAGYYDFAVYVQRPDGIRVSVHVGNGTLGGTPHLTRPGWPWVTRTVPPGSLALWRSVAESRKLHL